MGYQIHPKEVPIKDHDKPGIIAVKSKELDDLNKIDFKTHENNGHNCKQCNSWYESREYLEYHKRIKHREYNDEQIHSYQNKCDSCKKQFKDRNEQVEHWEEDHEVHIYKCIYLGCRTKYICQEIWIEHMKKKHGIGVNCPQCNEFFDSRNNAIDHENEDECDQCGKWLGCETYVEKHTNKEHENRGLKIESHIGTQTLDIGTPSFYNENSSEEKLKTDRDNNESTDEIDEKNKGEIEEIEIEVGAEIQIIRPHAPIDGDNNGDFEC